MSKKINKEDIKILQSKFTMWDFYEGGQRKLLWSTQLEIFQYNPDVIVYVGGAPGDWVNDHSKYNETKEWICIDRQTPKYKCVHINDYVTIMNLSQVIKKIPLLGSLMMIWDVRKLRNGENRKEWNELVIVEWKLALLFLKELLRYRSKVIIHIKIRPFYYKMMTEYLKNTNLKLQAFNRLNSHELRCVGVVTSADVIEVNTKELIVLIDETYNNRRDESYALDLKVILMRLQK